MRRRRLTYLIAALVSAGVLATSVASADAARRGWFTEWSDFAGDDPIATVDDLEVSRDAIVPGSGAVTFSLHSTTTQHLRITAADERGRTVRAIADADVAEGDLTYTWDGTDDTGALVPDGDYEVVVEADDGRDSMSIADEIRIDRAAPKLTVTTTPIRIGADTEAVRVPIRLSEPAMLEVVASGNVARGRAISERPAGRQNVVIPLLATARGTANLSLRLTVSDAAGNEATGTATIPVTIEDPSTDGGSSDDGDGGSDGSSGAPTPSTPIVGSSTITWPLSGPLTSRYGMRWGRMHQGIDLGVPTGRSIGAAAPGTVTYSGWMSGYGNTVIISHGKLSTLYGHQSKIRARLNQRVKRGQTIGLVGSTGNSTGPHLHFEVRSNGAAKDPLKYLP